jgi:hypothetical protein
MSCKKDKSSQFGIMPYGNSHGITLIGNVILGGTINSVSGSYNTGSTISYNSWYQSNGNKIDSWGPITLLESQRAVIQGIIRRIIAFDGIDGISEEEVDLLDNTFKSRCYWSQDIPILNKIYKKYKKSLEL